MFKIDKLPYRGWDKKMSATKNEIDKYRDRGWSLIPNLKMLNFQIVLGSYFHYPY